jgi:NADH-quinone oxidoreductase subunit L
MQDSINVALIPLFPLIGAILVGLWSYATAHSKFGPPKGVVALMAVAGPVLSCIFALKLVLGLANNPAGYVHQVYTWFSVGQLQIPVTFYCDRLSGVMIFVITFVGSLIHLYSVGYMWEDRGFARYFSYLNLFTFSMLVLVLAKNLPLMFLGWEGVGAMSYLLIGFWFTDTEKALAANKAFIVNRIGDFGFLLGIFALFYYMGTKGVYTLDFAVLRDHANLFTPVMASVIGLLLFVGATGKSAQIPLHVWLADAMAGPTPVSALIHAATMVTAGVYMVARMSFMYTQAPLASHVITGIGLATAFMAATIAITQNNIKKVLAYSTVSQLGYMFMGVGVGAYWTGVFHLFTHAFFKALLFLGAGAIIHAMHHEEDMSKYGGLKKYLPVTFTVMLIACLAISGVPPFAGFFSKDAILAATWNTGNPFVYVIGLLTAGMTAFYMFRLLFLTFFGEARSVFGHHDHEGPALADPHRHTHTPKEGPWTMVLPLVVLAIGSVVVGFLGLPGVWGGSAFEVWLAPALPKLQTPEMGATTEFALMALSIIAGGLGILIAWLRYGTRAVSFEPARNILWGFAANKWCWDHFYRAVIVNPLIFLSRWGLWKTIDNLFIDGIVNGVPRAYYGLSGVIRYAQTGVARFYAYAMLVGTLVIFLLVALRFSLFQF